MTDEIRLAFEHPIARAEASSLVVFDRISLRDHTVEVEIGAFQQERGTTQRVCFNIVVEVRPADEVGDDVDRILSYDKVTEAVAFELAAERFNLLETLAERVAERILLEPQAIRTFVRIEKLDRGPGALGIELVRSKDDLARDILVGTIDTPKPSIIYLSNAAINSENLGRWLDILSAQTNPTVLCVGLPKKLPALTEHALVDRRIELLAIEQNAWMLASRDDRCVVIETKTELDWAMKNAKISVWAPSKMVLDATQAPPIPVADTVALASWLAQTLEAEELQVLGDFTTEEQDFAIRALSLAADAL
ncbi:MAG: dihydroneopterin aldolase [Paracoccaceae bacterium]|nr:dihydroneopterin aldolase [Paracoccaceae bacterium]